MKRGLTVVVILLLAVTMLLYGCDTALAPLSIQDNEKTSVCYKVYVSGAVENDGYYNVLQGATVLDAITQAGILDKTVLPENVYETIKQDTAIYLDYLQNYEIRFSIDLNGGLIAYNVNVEGIDADVIESIRNYVFANGKITNKNVLKLILGEKYADNYYKFYIGAEDYEASD